MAQECVTCNALYCLGSLIGQTTVFEHWFVLNYGNYLVCRRWEVHFIPVTSALGQKEHNLFAAQNFTCIVGKCLQDHRLMKGRAQLTRVIIWPIVLVGHWELKSKKVWSVLKIVQMDGTRSSGHTALIYTAQKSWQRIQFWRDLHRPHHCQYCHKMKLVPNWNYRTQTEK